MIKVVSAYKTDIGLHREHNEDYIWVNEDVGLYIVADGVGGHQAGEVASQMAAETVGKIVTAHIQDEPTKNSATDIKKVLIGAVETANNLVHRAAQQNQHQGNMRTTVIVALFQLPTVYICHAGDSRAYLLRESPVQRLTDDDVWSTVGRLRNILTKAVGQEHPLDPQFVEFNLMANDWLLLCSDGLWDMVPEEEIVSHLQQAQNDPAKCVASLTTAANEAGGTDNISVIAIKLLSM